MASPREKTLVLADVFGAWRIQKRLVIHQGFPAFFHTAMPAKTPGQNCKAPLKPGFSMQSKESRRGCGWQGDLTTLWAKIIVFKGDVFLRGGA